MAGRILAVLTATLLAGCAPEPSVLEQILARGKLNVATLNSPTTYYQGAHGPQGAEYQLATAFAADLGVELHLYTVPDAAALRAELKSGRADVIAAGITPDYDWQQSGTATTDYQQIPQLVVAQRGQPRVRNIAALAEKRIVISKDSPQLEVLDELRARGAAFLQWEIVTHSTGEPLALVEDGKADYAVVDANEFAYAQHLYPGVSVAFTLPDPRGAHWIVPRRAGALLARVNAFFEQLRQDKRLEPLLATATPESPDFQLQTSQRLQKDIALELPVLRPHFEDAASETGVDWRLLAALGYVESKWQTMAVSGDGAQGVMMLTSDTAASLGVTDRNDARQSILAGARYFVKVRDQIPDRIQEPDRTWFTLAAYNVGYGHLEDARKLAQSRGKNPDAWVDVRGALPLLAMDEYYVNVKFGFARGWEPVQMVDKVQLFLKLLEWQGEALGPTTAAQVETHDGA
jgi:membrane-bound lytic murein transglycosylase F